MAGFVDELRVVSFASHAVHLFHIGTIVYTINVINVLVGCPLEPHAECVRHLNRGITLFIF